MEDNKEINGNVELEIKQTDKEVVEQFLSNKENKILSAEIGQQIKEVFPNWFNVAKLVKKFKLSTAEAMQKIEILMMFNMCVGKVEKNIPYFRIDLDQRVQREILDRQIQAKEKEIAILKEKLTKLE
mgnify:FL=1